MQKKCWRVLREVCFEFPEVEEGLQWGHTVFKAGKKTLCTIYADETLTLSFWAGAEGRATLTFDER